MNEQLWVVASDVQTLIDYAKGRTNHVRKGLCPDEIEGHDTRDPACPVCRALIGAELSGQDNDRWYCIDAHGAAHLCAGREDALDTAAEADQCYPKNSPHIAARLVPDSDTQRAIIEAAKQAKESQKFAQAKSVCK